MACLVDSARAALGLPTARDRSPTRKAAVALGVYLVWTALTWLLEGRIRTFLRPEATADRLLYTGIANVLVGTLLALWVVRGFVAAGFVSRADLGFRSVGYTLLAVLVAGLVGVAQYVAQGPATLDPVVVTNVFAQVLPVSIAEVVVCWVVIGGSVRALLCGRGTNRYLATAVALAVSSVLFGLYHFAHSPPYNAPGMVGLLALVSVGTGLFFFVGRTVYGALVYHNFLALFGITASLADAGQLVTYGRPIVPLLATGLVALLILLGADRLVVRG